MLTKRYKGIAFPCENIAGISLRSKQEQVSDHDNSNDKKGLPAWAVEDGPALIHAIDCILKTKIKADGGRQSCYNNRVRKTIRIELHCHTSHSGDGLISPQKILEICQRKGIDRIVVTDHNTIAGARAAYARDRQRVIVGEEIMTTSGELLAAFVQEEVPPGLSPAGTIRILRDQGAFISVSHPFDPYRKGHWKIDDLLEISPLVDAIEVFNARCMRPLYNEQALEFARQHALLGTVGSDAHAAFEVGRATMLLPDFEDAAGLKGSLASARQEVKLSGAWVHLFSRYAKWTRRLRVNPG